MPRTPRLDVPGVAQHVIQRGNDRQACFFRELDYIRYRQDLHDAAAKFGCRVHAYVLMTNHVHLLVTPDEAGAVGRMMQALGRRYVPYVNAAKCRSGTLWEGRYRASLVDHERYVMACHRYIESNPVRAGMVSSAGDYRWSSFAANGEGKHDPLVTPHDTYLRLAADAIERRAWYRAFVGETIPEDELEAIRLYAKRQRALGSETFQSNIEHRLQRRAGLGKPGRPKKESVL